MKYNYIFIIILTVLLNINAICQNNKDHAKFNFLSREYVINKDGSIDYTYHKEIKLLSLRSFNSDYGETFIIYNPSYQSIKINESYTLRADGSKVITPKNAFTEGLPFSCTDCGRYNGLREKIITHTALELGGTIVLDYTIHSQPKFFKDFMETIDLTEYCPVTKYVITVKVPSTFNLKSKMLNMKLSPDVSTDNVTGDKTYTWKVSNVKQSSNESYLPSDYDMHPILMLSTCKDMQKAYFELVNQDALRNYALPQCKNILNTITNDTSSKLNNMLAIRDYVVDAIHYNNFSPSYNDYIISPASVTWNSACGNEADIAILLTAMLRTAGFEASPTCIVPETIYSDDVACLNAITHYVVKVILDGKDIYLSPTEKNNTSLDYSYNGYMSYLLNANVDHASAKLLKPIDNSINMNGSFTINKNGNTNGNIACTLTSKYAPSFTMLENTSRTQKMINGIKGEAKDVKINSNTLIFNYATTNIDVSETGNSGYYSFELPTARNSYNINPGYLNAERSNRLKCGKTDESYSYTITLPTDCSVLNKAVETKVEKSFGNMSIIIKPEGNTLKIIRTLNINQDYIDPQQYSDFRNMIILWNNINYQTIIFR